MTTKMLLNQFSGIQYLRCELIWRDFFGFKLFDPLCTNMPCCNIISTITNN